MFCIFIPGPGNLSVEGRVVQYPFFAQESKERTPNEIFQQGPHEFDVGRITRIQLSMAA